MKNRTFGNVVTLDEIPGLKCSDCGKLLFESTSNNAFDDLSLHCRGCKDDPPSCGAIFEFKIEFAGNPLTEKQIIYIKRW